MIKISNLKATKNLVSKIALGSLSLVLLTTGCVHEEDRTTQDVSITMEETNSQDYIEKSAELESKVAELESEVTKLENKKAELQQYIEKNKKLESEVAELENKKAELQQYNETSEELNLNESKATEDVQYDNDTDKLENDNTIMPTEKSVENSVKAQTLESYPLEDIYVLLLGGKFVTMVQRTTVSKADQHASEHHYIECLGDFTYCTQDYCKDDAILAIPDDKLVPLKDYLSDKKLRQISEENNNQISKSEILDMSIQLQEELDEKLFNQANDSYYSRSLKKL